MLPGEKSSAQHPPSCASCLKCHFTSFPIAITGPVSLLRAVFYANLQQDAQSAVPAQTRGGILVLGWVGELAAGRRMLVQTGNDSQASRVGYPGSSFEVAPAQAQAGPEVVQLC